MINYKYSLYLKNFISRQIKFGKKVGFVPTMGALHAGHISLIKAAKSECDLVVCSIFVNPTQFNNQEDLVKYPRTLEADITLLEEAGCDVLFAPSVKEMYPNGPKNGFVVPKVGAMLTVMEGAHRPGHFEGMMQVVSLLLDKVNPTHLFMGLKDYQQFAICCKMVELQKRKIEMRGMPTMREKSGLAMSSRNERLSVQARKNAAIIYKSLQSIQENKHKDLSLLKQEAIKQIEAEEGFEVEYLEFADKHSLMPSKNADNTIVLCAIWVENIRLIDNLIL